MEHWDLGGGRAMKKSSKMCMTPSDVEFVADYPF